jgi:hypothetical protein
LDDTIFFHPPLETPKNLDDMKVDFSNMTSNHARSLLDSNRENKFLLFSNSLLLDKDYFELKKAVPPGAHLHVKNIPPKCSRNST